MELGWGAAWLDQAVRDALGEGRESDRHAVKALARGFFLSSAGAGAGLRGAAPSVSPGTRSRHAPLSLEQLVGAMNVTPPQQYADVGSAFAAPLPPLPASCLANLSAGGASGAGEAAGSGVPGLQGIVRDGGERLLDVLLDERVFLFLREARTDAVSWERHLKWLRSDPRGDTEVLPSEGCPCIQYYYYSTHAHVYQAHPDETYNRPRSLLCKCMHVFFGQPG